MARDSKEQNWTTGKVKVNGKEYTFEYKIVPGKYILKAWGEQEFENYQSMINWFVNYIRSNR